MRRRAAASRAEEEARALAETVRAMAELRRDEYRRKRFASLVLAAGLGIALGATFLLPGDDSALLVEGDHSTVLPAPWVGAMVPGVRWIAAVALLLLLVAALWWSVRMLSVRHAADRVIAGSR
jgi:hypothetical protein